MNTITYSTEEGYETKKVPDLDDDGVQKKDKDGNLLYKEEKVTKTILTISINHKTAAQEASTLHFNAQQLAQLNELLDVKNASLWAEILRGVGLGSNELVNLALSQLGNEGGEKSTGDGPVLAVVASGVPFSYRGAAIRPDFELQDRSPISLLSLMESLSIRTKANGLMALRLTLPTMTSSSIPV